MNCPRCQKTMQTIDENGVRVETCSDCRGLFLDKNELNRIAEEMEGDLEYSSLAMESFSHDDDQPPTACPKCETEAMRKVDFVIYTNIILDWCPSCEGFWLDGGEYDRINTEVRDLKDDSNKAPTPPMWRLGEFLFRLPF